MSETVSTTRGLLVSNGTLTEVQVGDYRDIQDKVGGFFTTAFRVHLDTRKSIDGYCDDEFLLKESIDWNVVLEEGTLYGASYPIGGNIVIVGGDPYTGEQVDLTPEEVARFSITTNKGMLDTSTGRVIPTLCYREEVVA
jgi:hypothetical protein